MNISNYINDFTHLNDAVYDEILFDHSMHGVAQDWSIGFQNKPHFHQCGQLIYASSGTLNVVTTSGIWVVPPQRAVWMPPQCVHIIRARTDVTFRTVYLDQETTRSLCTRCQVLFMTPLLREAILELVRICGSEEPETKILALCEMIREEISGAPTEADAIHLPLPADARVQAIVAALLADPTDPKNREQWANLVGASGRTIDRVFTKETGMSFGAWRRHALLLEALRRLSENIPVTTVALELGYNSISAFNTMFKQKLGVTPKRFYDDRRISPPREGDF